MAKMYTTQPPIQNAIRWLIWSIKATQRLSSAGYWIRSGAAATLIDCPRVCSNMVHGTPHLTGRTPSTLISPPQFYQGGLTRSSTFFQKRTSTQKLNDGAGKDRVEDTLTVKYCVICSGAKIRSWTVLSDVPALN